MARSPEMVSAIRALGYQGSRCLLRCGCDELPCPLLSWLCAQLRAVCPELPESNSTSDVLLVGELRQLLSDMSSPLTEQTSEVLDSSVLSKVTEFLVSELQAARMIKHREELGEEKATEAESPKEQRVEDDSRDLAEEQEGCGQDDERRKAEVQAEWILLLRALDMDASCQFTDVISEVQSRLARLPGGDMMNPLLNSTLTAEQWSQVKKINQVLAEDYQCRRQMMIKRFQVTLESFAWGEKQKERSKALASVPPLSSLAGTSRVSLSHLISAREDQSVIEPIKAGTSTPVYKTLMGSVPDRGGRPGEIEPPMPAWEDRRSKGNWSGRGGGRQQRHRYPDKKKKGKRD